MTVTVAGTWTGGFAPPSGFSYVQSATNPVQVSVANTAGDWMISVMAWQQPQAGGSVSACMSDDVHDWWEPVGAPSADSPAAGLVRCSVWAAPAARAASYVQACPTAPYTSLAVAAYDVQGIGNGWAPQVIGQNYGNSATSLTVPGGSVATQSLVITVLGSAQWGATITPPAGWTPLTGSTIAGLGLASQSITVAAAYQVITGTVPAAAWTVSGSAVALAGVTVAIPLAATVPALQSPDWPAVITEAAIGSGPQVPPAEMAWTDLSARSLAMQAQQGRQYSLSQLQAGQGTLTLDNPDGALIPGSGAPVTHVGATLDTAAMGAADWNGAVAIWQSLTGQPVPVTRVYLAPSTFSISPNMTEMIASGVKLCISLRPAYNPVSSTDLANMTTFLQALKAAGAKFECDIWAEPFNNGLTAAQCIAAYQYYGPTVRQYCPLVFCSAAYTMAFNNEGAYYPGDWAVDKVTTDYYASVWAAGVLLPVANISPRKPFGLWEVGTSTDPTNGQTQAQATAFAQYTQGYMQGLQAAGQQTADVIWFNAGGSYNLLPAAASTFETGTPPYTGSNATVADSSAQAHTGTQSLAITAAAAGTAGAALNSGSWVSVTAGTAYRLSAFFRAASTGRPSQVVINWYTSGTGFITSTAPAAVTDATTGWVQSAVAGAAPATAALAQVVLQTLTNGGATEVHWTDDAVFATQDQNVTMIGTDAGASPSSDYRIPLYQSLYQALNGTSPAQGVDSGTPVRRRCYWPGGAWQVQWHGNGSTGSPQADTFGVFTGLTGGVTYSASAWVACSSAYPAGATLVIQFENSGGGVIGTATSNAATGPAATLCVASGTAPAGTVKAGIIITAAGTPASSVVFSAAAGPSGLPGQIAIPSSVTWNADNGATVTTLAPWKPDPRGAPQSSPWLVPFSGYFRRWPFSVPGDGLRGQTVAEIGDIWAYATGTLNSMAREEMLIDAPYAMWPLDSAAGAPAGSNLAPGNSNGMVVTTAKLGAGGATQAWGANSGALLGDSGTKISGSGKSGGGSGMWQLTLAGNSLSTNGYGYALVCQDPNLPSLSGGVTCETWFACNSGGTITYGFFNTANVITVTGTSFANGQPLVFITAAGFTLPTGMTAGTIYYVVSVSGATFSIATTPGGTAVTLSTNGAGLVVPTTAWNPHIMVLRTITGLNVAEVDIRNTDGALLLLTTSTSGAVTTTVIDTGHDYRMMSGEVVHLSLALTATTYRVIVNGGEYATVSGTMTAVRANWGELCLGGAIDRSVQGYTMPGFLSLAAVYPGILSPLRVEAHFFSALTGLTGDHADTRVDRILSYAGLAGRRWIGQQSQQYEIDQAPSGQDIGGQAAATCASNIAASTVPAILYVAPSGDIVYWAKQYSYNQAVKWVLGDNVAAGEIPFALGTWSTDYDPTRLYNDVQLTQLDTQTVTVPAGATASATVAAMVAASQQQYGAQPYQQTSYLQSDYSSAYNAGSGLVDLAAWIAMVYGKPRNRVPAVTVSAAAHPSAWPLWGQAAVGDMVQVNVRLPTAATSPIVSVIARITQTSRAMKWTTAGASATIALALDGAPEYDALTCDDAVRGLLNGENVIGW